MHYVYFYKIFMYIFCSLYQNTVSEQIYSSLLDFYLNFYFNRVQIMDSLSIKVKKIYKIEKSNFVRWELVNRYWIKKGNIIAHNTCTVIVSFPRQPSTWSKEIHALNIKPYTYDINNWNWYRNFRLHVVFLQKSFSTTSFKKVLFALFNKRIFGTSCEIFLKRVTKLLLFNLWMYFSCMRKSTAANLATPFIQSLPLILCRIFF